MSVPPKIKATKDIDKKSINVATPTPPELRQAEIHELPLEKLLNLPNGIHINNIDDAFVRYVQEKFDLTSNGDKIPVYFYSQERYFEFTQQWLNSDSTNTPELPFVSITRDPIVKKGTGLNGTFNIPGEQTFVLNRDVSVRNGKVYTELHSISQPIFVDIKYNVSVFTTKLYDVDKFNERKLIEFQSRQSYLSVLGHFMPVLFEGEDDNTVKDINKRRYYHHQYNLTLKGYLVDEEKFTKTTAMTQINLPIGVDKKSKCFFSIYPNGVCGIIYEWAFPRKDTTPQLSTLPQRIHFTASNQSPESFLLLVNSQETQIPFIGEVGDILEISPIGIPPKEMKIKLYGDTISS